MVSIILLLLKPHAHKNVLRRITLINGLYLISTWDLEWILDSQNKYWYFQDLHSWFPDKNKHFHAVLKLKVEQEVYKLLKVYLRETEVRKNVCKFNNFVLCYGSINAFITDSCVCQKCKLYYDFPTLDTQHCLMNKVANMCKF